jgi:catechol O-methyltransferase
MSVKRRLLMDKFAVEKSMLVNVGDEKGELLDAAVRRTNPKRVLELGTYCGYSALRIARAAPEAEVFSIELSPDNAEVAQHILAHAGVDDRVGCVVGTVGDGGVEYQTLIPDLVLESEYLGG